MDKRKILVLAGSFLLIIAGFLPWISVPDLYGIQDPYYEGIEIGWEGDGYLTAGAGLILLLGELSLGLHSRRWLTFTGVVLAALAVTVVLLDFRQILKIAPETGFYAATDIGIYVTLVGALLALIGSLPKRIPASMHPEATPPGSTL